jgi:aspartokinase/homoserine dehydrogenase 1
MSAEASRGPSVIVVSALAGVPEQLARAAEATLDGETIEPVLRDVEERHFAVVRNSVDIKRQSGVIAGVRHRMNQVEDVLGGVGLLRELSPRTADMIAAHGRWLASYVFSEGLKERLPDVRLLDPRELIVTDDRFDSAHVRFAESRERIRKALSGTSFCAVAAGSVGATAAGDATTLGRGGGKLSASVLAAAAGASELVIWTESDGILTADPKRVAAARPIERMSYVEATEIMHFGGFLYPPALIPAMKHRVPIRVRNASNPGFAGTLISSECVEDRRFAGISVMDDVALLLIQGSGMVGVTGVAMRLFRALARAGVNVILISQASSEHSICVGILAADSVRAQDAVTEEFKTELDEDLIDDVTFEDRLSILAVVGERMKRTMGLAAIIFGTLGDADVNIKAIAQGSSELNVSIVIDEADSSRALEALHKVLIERQ